MLIYAYIRIFNYRTHGEVEKTKIKASDVIVPKYKPKSKRVTSGNWVISEKVIVR